MLLHTRIGPRVWVGAAVATVGLAVLGLNGLAIGFGETITLVSAAIYAVHIVGLGAWATAKEAVELAVVQMIMTGAVCMAGALIVEGGVTLPTTGFDWLAIAYMAVVSGAVAMIVQSWAQAHLAPSRAAIIMSTEPAWAAPRAGCPGLRMIGSSYPAGCSAAGPYRDDLARRRCGEASDRSW